MDHIDAHLATATQDLSYPLSIRAALAIGKKTLNRYYNKTDHSEVYRIAMGMFPSSLIIPYANSHQVLVLHPCHKLKYFRTTGGKRNGLKLHTPLFVKSSTELTHSWMLQVKTRQTRYVNYSLLIFMN